MWKGQTLRRADCLAGAALGIIGGFALFRASKMPLGGMYGGVDNPWYASPAAFPLLIGSLLLLSGLSIFLGGMREGGHRGLGEALGRAPELLRSDPGRRGLLVVLLLGAYFGLILAHWVPGRQGENYIAASTVFLSGFSLCFYRPRNRFPKVRAVLAIVLGAFALSWAVAALFSGPLHVPLP